MSLDTDVTEFLEGHGEDEEKDTLTGIDGWINEGIKMGYWKYVMGRVSETACLDKELVDSLKQMGIEL